LNKFQVSKQACIDKQDEENVKKTEELALTLSLIKEEEREGMLLCCPLTSGTMT
jgi:hypothetical protein